MFTTCLQVPSTPTRQEQPKKEKSGFAVLCGALLHLVVLLGAAWGSWTSQHNMPMMPLYHQHISREVDATGLPPPPHRVTYVMCDVLASTCCKHARQEGKVLCYATIQPLACTPYIVVSCSIAEVSVGWVLLLRRILRVFITVYKPGLCC